MNDDTSDLDQADEDILTDTVSDEALEAAGTQTGALPYLAPSVVYQVWHCVPASAVNHPHSKA
jgi:hypothetical protein